MWNSFLKKANESSWSNCLPNAKELQSIVDYTRSLQTTNSPAINPIFETTEIIDPNGNKQYPYFWTSTTHLDGKNPNASAVYIAFGEAQGKMRNNVVDVHGAGAQRSDPKSGMKENYPEYFGPQGDVRYVYNYVRAVRDIKPTTKIDTKTATIQTQQVKKQNQPWRIRQHIGKQHLEQLSLDCSIVKLLAARRQRLLLLLPVRRQ